ncbi:hypothetical protein N7474_000735 [Penicillium riverlandense]|uniref:uncharacterized protein n=1 Tax=Penicillium riverlandense TaxID=1903569 RepID=UPI0025491F89|nr:uncharacterized protein N7474_000735 [Penicillium riverlandense]KAJ5832424.1 hypothetical protein N7474_000735 [Penicillium riverlandense]
MAPDFNKEELSQHMRDLVFGGHLGPAQGKAVTFDVVREDTVSIIFIAALISLTGVSDLLDRYLICLAKEDGALLSTTPVSLDKDAIAKAIQEAGCGELVYYNRLCDGTFGTTYKAKAYTKSENKPDEYVVQLRYHANIASMYHLIQTFARKAPKGSQLLMARAFAALWDLSVPRAGNLIGEPVVSPEGTISVGPERLHGLGGPFSSVTSYIQAWIKHRVNKLQTKQAIDEYKDKYMSRILRFTESSLNHIPVEIENVKLSLVHTDLGLHNMIFSESRIPKLKGVIDWEFVDHAPPLIAIPTLIEPTFEFFPSESDELRQAFWDEIPQWKEAMASKGSKTLLDLYSFGFYLKADALPDRNADLATKEKYWENNANFVERFLERWESPRVSV